MKFTHFAPLALGFATVALAGCSDTGDEAAAPVADEVMLEVSNARLMLPAVSDRPGAIYFDVENTGDRNYAIRRADVDGAGGPQGRRARREGTVGTGVQRAGLGRKPPNCCRRKLQDHQDLQRTPNHAPMDLRAGML